MPTAPPPPSVARPPGLVVLAVVLVLEALELVAIASVIVLAALGTRAPASGIAAGVTVLVAAALLVGVAVGTVRARPRTRAATFVWQVVQVLVGLYAFQGSGPAVGFAVAAIVPAAVALALLFTRPVRDATARPERR